MVSSALIAASVALLAPMLAVSLWNVARAPRLGGSRGGHARPRVSVLVPARNEGEILAHTLTTLLALDYPDFEVVVLDDASEDGTRAVALACGASAGGRLRVLDGEPLPGGWLGKSWACHQLATAATGELLIFCDADVAAHPKALRCTVAALHAADAGVVTALPRQRMGGWMEHAVVPLVTQLPVLALLPLNLVPRVRAPSFSMANGQWLAFTRDAYLAVGGHAAVRGDVVEDVALGRRAKAAGFRLLPMVAPSLLEVRMYRGGAEVRAGFAKNLYPLVGGTAGSLTLAAAIFALVGIFPWVAAAAGIAGASVPLAMLLGVRVCGAVLFRHGIRSVLLHPMGTLLLAGIAAVSFVRTRTGAVEWKGRRLPRPAEAR